MRLVILFALAIAAGALGGWSWHYEQEVLAIQLVPADEVKRLSAIERREREDQVEIDRALSGKLAWQATVAGGLAVALGIWWLISTLMGWGERIALIIAMLIGAAVPATLIYLGPLHL